MNDYSKELKAQQDEIDQLIQQLKNRESMYKGLPKGTIRVTASRGKAQYFFRKEGDTKSEYLHEKDKELAYKLVQREYDRDALRKLDKMKRDINRFLRNYNSKEIEEFYANLCEGRKAVVKPLELTDAMYVEKWLEEHLGEKNPYPETGKYETMQGEYVRSKSEKIIADTLYKMKVPYHYEAQLSLGINHLVYPDFTCLNVRKRKTIYWEHLGLLNMDAYVSKNHEKLALYEQNGILLGDTLMVSFETADCPLNIAVLRKKIEAILK